MTVHKKTLTWLVVGVLMLPGMLFAQQAAGSLPWPMAATFGDNVILESSDTVEKDFIAAGQHITISGTVLGDAYVAGETITINGTIQGDLVAAGRRITVASTAQIGEDARIAGQEIILSGSIGRDATTASESITIEQGGTIGGDVYTAARLIAVNGAISGQSALAGDMVTLTGTMSNNVTTETSTLTVAESATINGTLAYSAKKATIPDSAQVAQKLKVAFTDRDKKNINLPKEVPSEAVAAVAAGLAGAIASFIFFLKLVSLLGALLIGVIIIALFRPILEAQRPKTSEILGQQLLIGFITIVALPIASVLVLLTVIGFPLGMLGLVAWGVLLYLAPIVAAIILGTEALTQIGIKNANPYLGLLLGKILFVILGFIPFLGWFILFVVKCYGLGVLAKIKYATYRTITQK